MTDHKELLAEARELRTDSPKGDLVSYVRELADALESIYRDGEARAMRRLSASIQANRDIADQAVAERDAALAVIEQLRHTGGLPIDQVWEKWQGIFAQSPASALAKVKADALREAAAGFEMAPFLEHHLQQHQRFSAANFLYREADRIEKEGEL